MSELSIKVEKMGQFDSKADWVHRAKMVFIHRRPDEEWKCFDKHGNHVHVGEDFRVAEELETYPVGIYRLIRTAKKQLRIDEEAVKYDPQTTAR